MKKIIFLVMCFCCVIVSDASAQIFLDQGKFEYEVTPGQNIRNSLTVHNTSDDVFRVKVYLEDFTYVEPFDGGKKFYPAGTTDRSIADWISYQPKEFVLEPHGKKEVSFSITAPGVISGGYYGVMFAEKEAVSSQSTKGISIIARVGSLFFLEAANKSLSLNISDFSAAVKTITGTMTNTGDVIAIPETVYYVLNSEGVPADRGALNKVYLPPGEGVQFSIPLSEELSRGMYTVVMTTDLAGKDVLVKEMDIEVNGSGINILEIRD